MVEWKTILIAEGKSLNFKKKFTVGNTDNLQHL
jgi:hypothetical protein